MSASFDESKRLHEANAKHRKGWRLDDRNDFGALQYAAQELAELQYELGYHHAVAPMRIEMVLDELADVLLCLDSFAIKCGFSQAEIEAAKLKKLAERFTEE